MMALLIAVALSVQYVKSSDREGFSAVNFFSYFTVLSNVAAAALLLWETARPPDVHTPRECTVRGAVTLYMCITGLVYAVLLAPASADVDVTEAWVDAVVHEIAPIAVLLDWVVEPARRLPRGWSVVAAWLLFPAAYLVYTLARGADTGWYPYPFLDPDESGGYGGVAAYSAGVLAAFVAVALALRWWALRSRAPEPAAAW